MKKRNKSVGIRVKSYEVLHRAVEEGFQRGWQRAHKHTENPTDMQLEEDVIDAIMADICEVFDFDE